MQNYINVFEEYYSKTPFKKILWNQLSDREIFDFLGNLNVPKSFKIVSLGCGTGQKEIYAGKNGYKNLTGIDISISAIQTARSLSEKAKINAKFYAGDITSITDSIVLKDIKEPDLLLDWMSFHTIAKKYRKKYIETVNAIDPRWFLIRTFSKKDSDYTKTKKDKLPNIGAEKIYRHFFNFEDLSKLFGNFYPVLRFDTGEYVNPKKFIDNKAAAKITILFLNKKRVF